MRAQEAQRTNPVRSISLFAEYSNTSSRMMIGEAGGRKLVAVGGSYNRLISTHRTFAYRYSVDVRPMVLIGDPYLRIDAVYRVAGQPDFAQHAEGPTLEQCKDANVSGLILRNGAQIGTYTLKQGCTRRWTYAGAVSPFGQRFNFFPRGRLQPYLAANAGFVSAVRDEPLDHTAMFNFSFELGGGLEWFTKPGKSWALDWRYHHISNAGRGEQNAGIDNGTVKLTYSFGR